MIAWLRDLVAAIRAAANPLPLVQAEVIQRVIEREDKAEAYRQRRRDHAARMEGLNPDKQASFEVKVRLWLDEDQPREDIERLVGHRLASVHVQMIKYGRGR